MGLHPLLQQFHYKLEPEYGSNKFQVRQYNNYNSTLTNIALHNTRLLYSPCIFKSLPAPTGIFATVPSVVRTVP